MAGSLTARLGIMGSVAMLVGFTMATNAGADVVGCGTTVTASITLTADVGPCPGAGLIVSGNGITVDLNGHTVRGDGNPEGTPAQIGILVRSSTGVVITNGVVRDFNVGVRIEGGSANTVRGMTITQNVGRGDSSQGDGLVISGSGRNLVTGNSITRNGPFTGINLLTSVGDTIQGNLIADNNVVTRAPGQDDSQDDVGVSADSSSSGTTIDGNQVARNGAAGLAIVGQGVNHFRITNNAVSDNGGTGIVPAGIGGHYVAGNSVVRNGYDQFRPAGTEPGGGAGILTCGRCLGAGDPTTIESNSVVLNNGPGISALFNGFLFNGNYTPPHPNVIQRNFVRSNVGDGIFVQCDQQFIPGSGVSCIPSGPPHQGIRVIGNTTGANGGSGAGVSAWDLHDQNANCDSNVWSANTFQTANPPCTTAP